VPLFMAACGSAPLVLEYPLGRGARSSAAESRRCTRAQRGDAWATYASYGKSTSTPRIEYVGILAIDGDATSLGGAMRAWIPRHARASQGGPLLDSTVWLRSSLHTSTTNVHKPPSNHITSQQSWPTLPRIFSDIYRLYQCPTVKQAASLACRTLLHNLGSPCHFTCGVVSATAKFSQSIYFLVSEI
jgi:hypothetical protein